MHTSTLLVLLSVLIASAAARAQSPCGNSLQTLDVPSGLEGALNDSVFWDRDGSGPLPAELVIGGAFRRVGGVVVNGVARLDAALGWQPLGGGCDDVVFSLAVDGANRLVIGGSFTTAGGVQAPRIARFDGAQWSALASPPPALTGQVTALAPRGASELHSVESTGLGYFDGTSTSGLALGPASGSFSGSATDVGRLPNGDLLIAGSFSSVAGQSANNVAIYERATGIVRTLQGGANNIVRDVEMLPNGEFFAFGAFTTVGGGIAAGGVARWTGTGWQPYVSPMLLVGVSGGGVNAAGEPVAFGTAGCSQFVAGAWQPVLANAFSTTHVRPVANGSLLIGNNSTIGTFSPPFGFFAQNGVATPVADGVIGTMLAAAEMPDGSIVGHLFTSVSNTTTALSNLPAPGGFVRYRDGAWTVEPTGAMPTTSFGGRAQIADILPQDDGSYIVAGTFASIGGVALTGVARFDGAAWHPVGAGPGGTVNRAVQLVNGDLVVGMQDNAIRRFDGAQWLTVAPAVTGEANLGLAACRDCSFVAVRRASTPSGLSTLLDRWVGSTRTSTVVPGAPLPQGAVELRDGAIALSASNGVMRFDGATLQTLGSLVNPNGGALDALPDGGVVANIGYGGNGTPVVRTTLRWDGATWTPLHASGFGKPIALRNGDVLVLGTVVLDLARAAAIARFATGCPSASTAVASGCATGAATLASDAPWLGQTLRLEATGLPLAAFAIAVGSTQSANLPLAGVFATAIPGCTLLVQPDVTSTQLAVAGKAQLAFAIPNTPALAGAAFREQFVHFALDPSLAVGATNALDLVVGSY